jgi:sugar phosphate isomerase/epimerase
VDIVLNRRAWLAQAPAALAAAADPAKESIPAASFGFCLNTSTISGQKLDVVEVVEIAAKAGYTAIEPWIRELDQYAKGGGSLKELGKRIQDKGLTVPSAIGFPEWIVDDDARRKKGMEEVKRCMDVVQQIGGRRLAAPPAGASGPIDLVKAAERYRGLLELGDQMGVVPELEFWGPSKALSRLSQAAFIAVEAGHAKACILADVYHLYKGGSSIDGLRLLNGAAEAGRVRCGSDWSSQDEGIGGRFEGLTPTGTSTRVSPWWARTSSWGHVVVMIGAIPQYRAGS